MIYYIYFLLFSNICNRTNHFGTQNKTNFDFYFQTWKSRKQNGAVGTKILNHLAPNQAKQITTEVLSQTKNPKDYQDREVHESEQHPIDFKITDETFQPTMVEIKTNNDLGKKRAEKRKQLERQWNENTIKMNKLKTK